VIWEENIKDAERLKYSVIGNPVAVEEGGSTQDTLSGSIIAEGTIVGGTTVGGTTVGGTTVGGTTVGGTTVGDTIASAKDAPLE
jgi:hypothetical protein